jgi:uncharacterized protein YcbX
MITITSLHTYPVKGLRGIDSVSATILPRGFEFDREWLVVDSSNRFITQRNANLMATIETAITATHLVLSHASVAPLNISLERTQANPESVTIWRDKCEAVDQGEEAAQWLADVLGPNDLGPVRLMRFAPSAVRAVEPDFLGDVAAEVGFADGYPYLVTNEATLDALNARLDAPVPMNRFRPNIVIRGLPALDEHKLTALSVPDREVTLLLPKPCQRCKVTTIDQQSGAVAESREPLKTLLREHSLPNFVGGYFGQNAVATRGLGTRIAVGDPVEVAYQ